MYTSPLAVKVTICKGPPAKYLNPNCVPSLEEGYVTAPT
jgi:hypothetical protein